MKKIFYFLLFLITTVSLKAQTYNEISDAAKGRVNYTPILTNYSNVAFSGGVIKTVPTATKAFHIKKSISGQGMTVYFTADGTVNRQAIRNFLDNDRGLVDTIYNQVTNGASGNAVQTVNANMAYVVIDEDVVKLRFEQQSSGTSGQSYQFTTSSISLNNCGLFVSYKAYCGAGTNGSFTKRNILGSSGGNFDLYANDAASDWDALYLGASSTTKLFMYAHNNCVAVESNASNAIVESNDSTATLAARTGTETTWTIGNNNAAAQPFSGDIFTVTLFNTALTASDVAKFKQGLQQINNLALYSPYNVIIDGDSLTESASATDNQGWVNQLLSQWKKLWVSNMAIAGSTIANLTTRAVHVDRQLSPNVPNILVLWIGTNDYALTAHTPATIISDLDTYIAARRSAASAIGATLKVVVVTMIPRGSSAQNETDRTTLNTSIKSDANIDVVADAGSDSRFAFVANLSGTNDKDYNLYYSDGVHLTNDGYKIIADYVSAALQQLIPNYN